ncbi:YgaP-like transmembrane domain [Cohnella kolymensis]|uniref:YgaP-like transmembrane domain n=1 Tax=Cohnella kolymensis TaxID=1590652 RepID=UPI001F2F6BA4|nr:YgaP-like transmembrane domain [Cohnella kolymensis]
MIISIRISAGTTILLLGLAYRSWWGLLGLGPLLTGSLRYCPVNQILRIDKCQTAS